MTVGVAAAATDGVPKPVIVGYGSMYFLGEKRVSWYRISHY